MRFSYLLVSAGIGLGAATYGASAEDVHLICRSPKETIRVDINIGGLEVSITWPGSSTELFKNGRSSIADGIAIGGVCKYNRHDYVNVREDSILFGEKRTNFTKECLNPYYTSSDHGMDRYNSQMTYVSETGGRIKFECSSPVRQF